MMFMNMLAAAMAWALPLYGCLSNLALEVRIYSKVGAAVWKSQGQNLVQLAT